MNVARVPLPPAPGLKPGTLGKKVPIVMQLNVTDVPVFTSGVHVTGRPVLPRNGPGTALIVERSLLKNRGS